MIKKKDTDDTFDNADFSEEDFDTDYVEDLDSYDAPDSEEIEYETDSFDHDAKAPYGEKKKRAGFNTIVIIGAFVLGAGVLAFNVMNKSAEQAKKLGDVFQSSMNVTDVMDGGLTGTNPTPVAPVTPVTPDSSANVVPQETVAQDNSSDSGFLNNDVAIDTKIDSKTTSETPPQPAPIVPAQGVDAEMTPIPEAVPTTTAEEANPIADTIIADKGEAAPLSADEILKKAMEKREANKSENIKSDSADMVKTPSLSDSTPTTPPEASDSVSKNDAFDQKMSQILSRMDKIEESISSIQKQGSNDYDGLAKTVSTLEKDLNDIKNTGAVPQDVPDAPVKKTASAKKKTISQPKAKQNVSTEPHSKGTWELRAAQPGRAWISKPGERDMQSVEVGQTVSGIGQVLSITYKNALWTITGTQGSISQQ